MDVDCIAFTGSTAIGKRFLQYAGAVEHEARLARVRRQEPEHRLRRLPRPATPRRARPRAASSSTRARSAPPARAAGRRARSRTSSSRTGHRRRAKTCSPAIRSIPTTRIGRDGRQTPAASACMGYIETGRTEGAELHRSAAARAHRHRRLLRRAHRLRRVRNDMTIAREEIFGPVLSTIAFDCRGRGGDGRQRHDLRPGGRGLDRQTSTPRTASRARSARASCGSTRTTRGDITMPVRWLQAVGLRSRQVDPRAREVHRPQDGLDRPALLTGDTPRRSIRLAAGGASRA